MIGMSLAETAASLDEARRQLDSATNAEKKYDMQAEIDRLKAELAPPRASEGDFLDTCTDVLPMYLPSNLLRTRAQWCFSWLAVSYLHLHHLMLIIQPGMTVVVMNSQMGNQQPVQRDMYT